jgi:hypothetical protein
MNRYNSKFTIVSICFISAILAFTIIMVEAAHITPALAQTTGSYSEVSRIINIPKDMPNSNSSSLPNDNPSLPNDNPSLPNGISNGILISPVVNNYQLSLMFV